MLRRNKIALCISAILAFFGYVNNSSAAAKPKEWTFLIYLNGNNNLDAFGKYNINQMEKVGSTDQVNVVVQWASLANKKTQRLLVVQDNEPTKVTSPIVQDLGAADMGDWHSLVDFVQWGAEHYPAKHYFIDVWDHGSGWHAIKARKMGRVFNPTDISWDDNSGNAITTPQLGLAMDEAARIIGHKVDVYGSDACLMAMAEVSSEMKNSVSYFLGSQDLEPGQGWPYDTILAAWNQKVGASAEEVSKIVTTEYLKSYQNGVNGTDEVTFSAFDLSKTDRMYSAIKELNRRLTGLEGTARKKAITAFGKSQMFYYSDYRDLGDFVNELEKAQLTWVLGSDSFNEVRQALSEYVIANGTTPSFSKAKGLSIWLPNSLKSYISHAEYYHLLRFQEDTKWGDTLYSLLK